jgi:hypothetical protein
VKQLHKGTGDEKIQLYEGRLFKCTKTLQMGQGFNPEAKRIGRKLAATLVGELQIESITRA